MEKTAVQELLCSSKKIERDRGLTELQRIINSAEPDDIESLEVNFVGLLQSHDSEWETKQGALQGSRMLVANPWSSENFGSQLKVHVLDLLNHNEARVRLSAGEVLGSLCKRFGVDSYVSCKELITEGIRSNLERIPLTESGLDEKKNTQSLVEKLAGSNEGSGSLVGTSAEQIFHDTAGWKNLETWMKCLQCVVEGCGISFAPQIDQNLLDLIFQALVHTNRFVRETGFQVCAAFVSCTATRSDDRESMEMDGELSDSNPMVHFGEQFTSHLSNGLADNWSQVRLAASVATRKFLLNLPSEAAKEKFYPALLPRMCLNRYYVAEGVRIYSQETWRQVTHSEGKQLVEKYIQEVVIYYINQTLADNHAVREAACACIAELGSKIDKEVVRPHVEDLLKALLDCFKDESWPVRDAACVACGNFVLCFPEESKPSMDALYPLFFGNIADNIPSVRQGAAVALGNVAKAYGEGAICILLDKIKEGIAGLEKQPESSERYSSLDKDPATFGVVKRLRDNDMELHSNKQMYSCGSLAPKMGRGSKGGCMDHQFKRPSEPWELCDGCIYLLSELSTIKSTEESVVEMLPSVADCGRNHNYTQHVCLLETICKQLPIIAKNIEKRRFKSHLDKFLDPLFYALSCDSALTSSAASLCLIEIGKYVGPNILKGRVENYNASYVDKLLANQFSGCF
ncbi:uncharacterized protein LOC117114802 [Anneissia japonica]|uniref:uncharacterized protein LOC117114802 n=1 Tax=Anneissia japonica TaxID=1529436 RepID=UPI0014256EC2|nr:uncharacterized protein LOC117114802 [Anneissia japonica]